MERKNELEELKELLETKQYTKLRQFLAELNEPDIAALMEELEEEVDFLKSIIKLHSEQIAELKKAQ